MSSSAFAKASAGAVRDGFSDGQSQAPTDLCQSESILGPGWVLLHQALEHCETLDHLFASFRAPIELGLSIAGLAVGRGNVESHGWVFIVAELHNSKIETE